MRSRQAVAKQNAPPLAAERSRGRARTSPSHIRLPKRRRSLFSPFPADLLTCARPLDSPSASRTLPNLFPLGCTCIGRLSQTRPGVA